MPIDEVITWVPVEEALPPEQPYDDEVVEEDGDIEMVMTVDAEGTLRLRCYREAGMWRSEDDGYDEEIEGEVVAWAKQPKGPGDLRSKASDRRGK